METHDRRLESENSFNRRKLTWISREDGSCTPNSQLESDHRQAMQSGAGRSAALMGDSFAALAYMRCDSPTPKGESVRRIRGPQATTDFDNVEASSDRFTSRLLGSHPQAFKGWSGPIGSVHRTATEDSETQRRNAYAAAARRQPARSGEQQQHTPVIQHDSPPTAESIRMVVSYLAQETDRIIKARTLQKMRSNSALEPEQEKRTTSSPGPGDFRLRGSTPRKLGDSHDLRHQRRRSREAPPSSPPPASLPSSIAEENRRPRDMSATMERYLESRRAGSNVGSPIVVVQSRSTSMTTYPNTSPPPAGFRREDESPGLKTEVENPSSIRELLNLGVKKELENPSSKREIQSPRQKRELEIAELKRELEILRLKRELENVGLMRELQDPEIKRELQNPSSKEELHNPGLQSELENPVIKREIQNPGLRRELEDPPSMRDILNPAIEKELKNLEVKRVLQNPGLKAEIENPSSKGELENPEIKRVLQNPSTSLNKAIGIGRYDHFHSPRRSPRVALSPLDGNEDVAQTKFEQRAGGVIDRSARAPDRYWSNFVAVGEEASNEGIRNLAQRARVQTFYRSEEKKDSSCPSPISSPRAQARTTSPATSSSRAHGRPSPGTSRMSGAMRHTQEKPGEGGRTLCADRVTFFPSQDNKLSKEVHQQLEEDEDQSIPETKTTVGSALNSVSNNGSPMATRLPIVPYMGKSLSSCGSLTEQFQILTKINKSKMLLKNSDSEHSRKLIVPDTEPSPIRLRLEREANSLGTRQLRGLPTGSRLHKLPVQPAVVEDLNVNGNGSIPSPALQDLPRTNKAPRSASPAANLQKWIANQFKLGGKGRSSSRKDVDLPSSSSVEELKSRKKSPWRSITSLGRKGTGSGGDASAAESRCPRSPEPGRGVANRNTGMETRTPRHGRGISDGKILMDGESPRWFGTATPERTMQEAGSNVAHYPNRTVRPSGTSPSRFRGLHHLFSGDRTPVAPAPNSGLVTDKPASDFEGRLYGKQRAIAHCTKIDDFIGFVDRMEALNVKTD